jgi:DNA-binding LytR/AlgR family response regulator
MKKIVIIEDEPLSAQRIARFVNEYDPEIAVAWTGKNRGGC